MLAGIRAIGTVAYMGGVMAVPEDFTWAWGQMIQFNSEALCRPGEYVHYQRVRFSDHAPARNAVASNFLGDWLLMLDTDHTFEPDLVKRMVMRMKEYDLQALVGLYRYKQPPCSPVIFKDNNGLIQPVASWDKSIKLMKIDGAGAGCLMVKRQVFDRIRQELRVEPFDRLPGKSEDMSFFERLRELEISIWCDPRIEMPHLRVVPVTADDQDLSDYVVHENIEALGYG